MHADNRDAELSGSFCQPGWSEAAFDQTLGVPVPPLISINLWLKLTLSDKRFGFCLQGRWGMWVTRTEMHTCTPIHLSDTGCSVNMWIEGGKKRRGMGWKLWRPEQDRSTTKRKQRNKSCFVLGWEEQKRSDKTRWDEENLVLMGKAGGVALLSVLAHHSSHYSFTPWLQPALWSSPTASPGAGIHPAQPSCQHKPSSAALAQASVSPHSPLSAIAYWPVHIGTAQRGRERV